VSSNNVFSKAHVTYCKHFSTQYYHHTLIFAPHHHISQYHYCR
jgi:hypothetical protein